MLHATTVAVRREGRWSGVLISGPSGSGKSTLALRLLPLGWRLVADDRTLVWLSGGGLFARAPATLSGLLEARTLGVLPVALLPWAEVRLALDCASPGAELERVPDPAWTVVAGVRLPSWRIDAHAACAPAACALLVAGRAL